MTRRHTPTLTTPLGSRLKDLLKVAQTGADLLKLMTTSTPSTGTQEVSAPARVYDPNLGSS